MIGPTNPSDSANVYCCLTPNKDLWPRDAQDLAAVAVEDGAVGSNAERIASLGTNGAHPANIERDMFSWLRQEGGLDLEFFWTPIRVSRDDEIGEETIWHPVLPPHEWLSALWDCGWDRFSVTVLGPHEHAGIARFWDTVRNASWAQGHPGLHDEFATPWSSFGDDASAGGTYNVRKFVVDILSCHDS